MFDIGPYGYLGGLGLPEADPPRSRWSGWGRCKGRPLSRHREPKGITEKKRKAARAKKASRRRNRHG